MTTQQFADIQELTKLVSQTIIQEIEAVKVLTDQVVSLDEKNQSTSHSIQQLHENITNHDNALENVKQSQDAIFEKLNRSQEMLDTTTSSVKSLDEHIGTLQQQLTNLQSHQTNELEQINDRLNQQMANFESNLGELTHTVKTTEEVVQNAIASQKFDEIQDALTQLSNKYDALVIDVQKREDLVNDHIQSILTSVNQLLKEVEITRQRSVDTYNAFQDGIARLSAVETRLDALV